VERWITFHGTILSFSVKGEEPKEEDVGHRGNEMRPFLSHQWITKIATIVIEKPFALEISWHSALKGAKAS
jgi:hypothetical protein